MPNPTPLTSAIRMNRAVGLSYSGEFTEEERHELDDYHTKNYPWHVTKLPKLAAKRKQDKYLTQWFETRYLPTETTYYVPVRAALLDKQNVMAVYCGKAMPIYCGAAPAFTRRTAEGSEVLYYEWCPTR